MRRSERIFSIFSKKKTPLSTKTDGNFVKLNFQNETRWRDKQIGSVYRATPWPAASPHEARFRASPVQNERTCYDFNIDARCSLSFCATDSYLVRDILLWSRFKFADFPFSADKNACREHKLILSKYFLCRIQKRGFSTRNMQTNLKKFSETCGNSGDFSIYCELDLKLLKC